jgi:signal transduction histidine kinase
VVTSTCVAAAAVALLGHPSAHVLRAVLFGVTCGTLVLLAVAFTAAPAASSQVDAGLREAREITQRGHAHLLHVVDRLMRGDQPAPAVAPPARVTDGDPFRMLASEIEQAQYQTAQGVLRVAGRLHGGRTEQQRVEILVNLARRMQSLLHREIEMLDDLEAQVEDPILLKGLFTVDHLATRLRRQSESLAVLGGSTSRRQWSRQVTMHEVLRAAVAEVEQYSRVKVVPPVEGVFRGTAVTDVIHLIAELVENATKFSPQTTIILLRAQNVAAGVAIEVEDRGLGILFPDQLRMNALLADPTGTDVDEMLRDGRIGLYVVATLARRHGIRVQLQNNIYGGTQAVVVLPRALLDVVDDHALPDSAPGSRDSALRLAPVPATASAGGLPVGSGSAVPAGLPARQAPVVPPAERVASGMPRSPDPLEAGSPASAQETTARPPLPKRQPHASVVPAPDRFASERSNASKARSTEPPPSDQITSLMADFQRGVRLAEDEDPSVRD